MTNMLLRLFGFGKAVDALDGETSKAYMGGLGLILTGIAGVLGGVAGIVGEVVAAHGGAAYITLATGLTHNPSAAVVLAGAASISKGVAVIGQRHALARVEAAQAVSAVPPVTPAQP